jgi:hypothetical protein
MTDIYTDYAQRGLAAANESMFIRWNDEEVGKTQVPMLGAEIRSDALGESNLDAALKLLDSHVQDGTITEETVGRSGKTWMRFMNVRVYNDDGEMTQAWRDTVDLVLVPLEDYPILDEDDFSERERENLLLEIEFHYGAAAELVIPRMYDYDIFSTDDLQDEVILEIVNDAIEAGETLTEQAASDIRFVYNRYLKFNSQDELPTLIATMNQFTAEGN